jgi:hypothetical protein
MRLSVGNKRFVLGRLGACSLVLVAAAFSPAIAYGHEFDQRVGTILTDRESTPTKADDRAFSIRVNQGKDRGNLRPFRTAVIPHPGSEPTTAASHWMVLKGGAGVCREAEPRPEEDANPVPDRTRERWLAVSDFSVRFVENRRQLSPGDHPPSTPSGAPRILSGKQSAPAPVVSPFYGDTDRTNDNTGASILLSTFAIALAVGFLASFPSVSQLSHAVSNRGFGAVRDLKSKLTSTNRRHF